MLEKIGKLLLLLITCYTIVGCTKQNYLDYDNILRMRIIANSDSEEDQQDKIIVKNTLIKYFTNEKVIDLDLMKRYLENDLSKELIEKIQISLTKSNYEAKSYQGEFIPSGEYETLLITIGEGKGHNFWTLLYPEFFNVTFEDQNEITYRSYFYDILTNKKNPNR